MLPIIAGSAFINPRIKPFCNGHNFICFNATGIEAVRQSGTWSPGHYNYVPARDDKHDSTGTPDERFEHDGSSS
jgi:hypothetical protein